ncbi:hypothetical protein ACJJIP_01330 [Microbulbifer sp. VTAC004]|uniref:hypothetical protein n=1 Tax=unclassified Microbulbifer TaxID=2619833 RepID=UPI004039029A
MANRKILAFFPLMAALSQAPVANELTGYAGLEARAFTADPADSIQSDAGISASLSLEYYRDLDDGNQRFVASAFGRWDSEDGERSHGDLGELYWWKAYDSFELYAGVRKVFWGVTETLHLVDVINQDDALENIDGEDKLGQPMVNLLMERDWGTLEVYGLLGFRERQFAGREGRLRASLPVDEGGAIYQSDREEKHIDWALRYSHVLGDWDLGLSHFSGTNRDPLLLSSNDGLLTPYYAQVDQTGVDIQTTRGDWLWKFEAISFKPRGEDRQTAAVGGFEYSLYGIRETVADLGLLMEYQFDDRRGPWSTANQNDIAVGVRYALNNTQDTEFLLAVSTDLDNGSRFTNLEVTHRLDDRWLLEAEARFFGNADEGDPTYSLRNDDYLQLELRRYF